MANLLDELPALPEMASVVLVGMSGRMIGGSSASELPASELRTLTAVVGEMFSKIDAMGTPAEEGIFRIGGGTLAVLRWPGHLLLTLCAAIVDEDEVRQYHQIARKQLQPLIEGGTGG